MFKMAGSQPSPPYFSHNQASQPVPGKSSSCSGGRQAHRSSVAGPLYYCITYCITESLLSVITVRVPKDIKRRLTKRRVNVSETVRILLEKHVKELELKDLADGLEDVKNRIGGRIDARSIAKLVREDREAR